jgi:hypothetical protein
VKYGNISFEFLKEVSLMWPRVDWLKLTTFGATRIKVGKTHVSKGRQIFVERRGITSQKT